MENSLLEKANSQVQFLYKIGIISNQILKIGCLILVFLPVIFDSCREILFGSSNMSGKFWFYFIAHNFFVIIFSNYCLHTLSLVNTKRPPCILKYEKCLFLNEIILCVFLLFIIYLERENSRYALTICIMMLFFYLNALIFCKYLFKHEKAFNDP